MKRQPTEWEKIFASGITNKGLISKIHKHVMQLNIRIMNTNQKMNRRSTQTFLQKRHTDGQKNRKRCPAQIIIRAMHAIHLFLIYVVFVQSQNYVQLFATPWPVVHQAPLSSTVSWSLLQFMSTGSVMPSNHLIPCHLLLLLLSIFSSIKILFSKLILCIRWPKYQSFSFSSSPSNEQSRLISFRIDWFDLLAVQGTLEKQFESICSSVLRLVYDPNLTSVHDYWINHSFNYRDFHWQSDVSAF